MYLAKLAYKASPTRKTLEKWDRVITATAGYLASYAWANKSSGYYDLGPPWVLPIPCPLDTLLTPKDYIGPTASLKTPRPLRL